MNRKIIGVIVVFLMFSSVMVSASVNIRKDASLNTDFDRYVQLSFSIGDYQIESSEQGEKIFVEEFGRLLIPGKPNLPSKIFSIAIPPGAEFVNLDYEIISKETLPGTYFVQPSPLPRVIGEEDLDVVLKEQDLYDKNFNEVYHGKDVYPNCAVEFVRTAGYRNFNLVDVRINPFSYSPETGQLEFFSELEIQINYDFKEEIPTDDLMMDSSEDINEFAEKIVFNYDQAKDWYEICPKNRASNDFVIITTTSLTSKVEDLADWEEMKGKTTEIVTTSWINSNYNGYDLAEKIRNFLRDKYPSNEWGIEDVLIVGDYDDVPMRRCAQDQGYGKPETDYYYAELSLPDDQSWDADGDHQYGENSDPIDFYAEVNVGRIPWSSSSTVEDICEKSISYEQISDPSFKKNMLLLGAYFWADTDNAELMEAKVDQDWMADWTLTRLYEQGHSTFPSDYNLDYGTVQSVWSSGKYAFVNWAGHGSPTSCHVMYSKGSAFVDSGTCNYLDDDYPAIIFADACSNSDTDHLNIGQSMLKQGAVGFVGATKVAYGMPGWNSPYDGSSQSMDYFFTTKVTSGEYSQGQAHQWALLEMYTNGLWYYDRYETFEWGALWGNPDLAMEAPLLNIGLPEELPELIDPGVPITIPVEIEENTDTYIEGSAKVYYRYDGGTYTELPMEYVSGDMYEATLPAVFCEETPEFYFSAQGEDAGTIYKPFNAPDNVYSALVGEFITVLTDDFESNTGWTIEDDPSLTVGTWERGVPVGGGERGDPANDYDGSGQCFLTANAAGDSDVDDGITWLISPTYDLSDDHEYMIEYALWYTNNFGNDPNNDLFKVYISDDYGSNWELAETIGPASPSGWNKRSFKVSDYVTPNNKIQLRFEASDLNEGSVVEAGIDAIKIYYHHCENPASPDLCCSGELIWNNAMPGETVKGSFKVENCGEPETSLNWKIIVPTSWGIWDFSPESGTDLRPQDGELTVNVEVVAPTDAQAEFTEKIRIENAEDVQDFCEVDVILKTPRAKTVKPLFANLPVEISRLFEFFEILLELIFK